MMDEDLNLTQTTSTAAEFCFVETALSPAEILAAIEAEKRSGQVSDECLFLGKEAAN